MPSRLGSLAQSTKDRVIKKIKEITEKQIDTISSLDMSVSEMASDPVATINQSIMVIRRVDYTPYLNIPLQESMQDFKGIPVPSGSW